MKSKVWFVTGASKGLGLSLVKQLLSKGYRVAATSRNSADLSKVITADSAHFLPLTVDIGNETSVANGIQQTITQFGSIDVVVNNAGYGLAGALEELSDKEARSNFDVNVFGSLNVIRQVMPHLRGQRSGHIFNISSIGGFTGQFPGFGIYCATKFAVQGLSESLAAEIQPFGIKVTIVSPGYFRTSFLDSSLGVPAQPIPAYENVRQMQSVHQQTINGNQMGDPDKASDVMIQVAERQEPLMHLFLGQDAYDLAYGKIDSIEKEMASVEALATATAFN